MQRTTRTRILQEGHPLAATISAPRANGNAKIVCEKRISRRKRDTGPPSPTCSLPRWLQFTPLLVLIHRFTQIAQIVECSRNSYCGMLLESAEICAICG